MKNQMHLLIKKLSQHLKEPMTIWFLVGLVTLITWMIFSQNPRSGAPATEEMTAIDTDIPIGFVLVPLEIENKESLSSMVDRFAMVDILGGTPRQVLAQHLRLLRAPLNPQAFAVLVPEGKLVARLAAAGPVIVVLENPHQKISHTPASTSGQIHYYHSPKEVK